MKKSAMGIALLFCASSSFAHQYFNHFSIDGQWYEIDTEKGTSAYLDIDESSKFDFNGQAYYHLKTAQCVVESEGEVTMRLEVKGLRVNGSSVGQFNLTPRSISGTSQEGKLSLQFDIKAEDKSAWVYENHVLNDSYSVQLVPSLSNKASTLRIRCCYR